MYKNSLGLSFLLTLILIFSSFDSSAKDKTKEAQAINKAQQNPQKSRKVTLKLGKIVGERRLIFFEDEKVRLEINSDQPMELHIHGYDIKKQLLPNQAQLIEFDAHTSGRFAVTSHGNPKQKKSARKHSHSALFYIEVHPR